MLLQFIVIRDLDDVVDMSQLLIVNTDKLYAKLLCGLVIPVAVTDINNIRKLGRFIVPLVHLVDGMTDNITPCKSILCKRCRTAIFNIDARTLQFKQSRLFPSAGSQTYPQVFITGQCADDLTCFGNFPEVTGVFLIGGFQQGAEAIYEVLDFGNCARTVPALK